MLRSPAHAKWAIDNPCEQTPALRIGSAVHCLTLEGEDEYQKRFAVASACTARKKDGERCFNPGKALVGGEWLCGVHLKADRHNAILMDVVRKLETDGFKITNISQGGSRYLEHEDSGIKYRVSNHDAGWAGNVRMLRDGRIDIRVDLPPYGRDDGRTILTEDEHAQVSRMADAVWEHPFARKLLNARTATEASYVWNDDATGVRCKARMDIVCGGLKTLCDLKTTLDASTDAFQYAIRTHHYEVQAAHYLAGPLAAEGVEFEEFAFICVEKNEPHCVAVYVIDPESIAIGHDRRREAITTWCACMKSGIWPGYSDSAQLIGLPNYEKGNRVSEHQQELLEALAS